MNAWQVALAASSALNLLLGRAVWKAAWRVAVAERAAALGATDGELRGEIRALEQEEAEVACGRLWCPFRQHIGSFS